MRATDDEIKQYVRENYGDLNVNSLSPTEQIDLGGAIANALGKEVYVRGLHLVPNKPRDDIADVGFIFLWVSVAVIVAILAFGFAALIISSF